MSDRASMALEMSKGVRLRVLVGLRRRNPGITDRDASVELIRLLHGDEMAGVAARHVDQP